MVFYGLSPVQLRFKGQYNVRHKLSNCRCDIVFVEHKDKFLSRGATKIKSKQVSEFGSQGMAGNVCVQCMSYVQSGIYKTVNSNAKLNTKLTNHDKSDKGQVKRSDHKVNSG